MLVSKTKVQLSIQELRLGIVMDQKRMEGSIIINLISNAFGITIMEKRVNSMTVVAKLVKSVHSNFFEIIKRVEPGFIHA